MQNFLLEMSKSHAPEMGMVYHLDTVLIAQDLIKKGNCARNMDAIQSIEQVLQSTTLKVLEIVMDAHLMSRIRMKNE